MAISNLQLNVRANTARALADFNKFSRSLDNKFLMSGLKLDVITSALDRINRDFQRAIGEQGLASASSLRAAQNQAALLTQTFKGFASDSAIAIQEQIGTALNRVAVTAGGTMKDVQKTLAATPFISTRLSEDMRDQLNKGILAFQRDARRAGLGENFGSIAQQFLRGNATGMDMVQSTNALESFIGAEIIKRSGGQGEIPDALMRSQVFFEVITDKRIQDMLQDMAKRAMGFRLILEDINTKLFNPEFGVFGALKKVVDSAGKTTTMFDEVENLTKQVFGEDGMFAALSKTLKEVLGPGFDPMRPFIDAVQGITKVFKALTDYFNSSGFKNVAKFAKDIFDRVYGVFRDIFNSIKGMSSSGFDEDSIIAGIRDIGKTIREYIQDIGKKIRDTDTKDETGAIASIAGTVLEEMGKSAVVLFKELLMTIIDKVPEIAMQVLPALNNGINAILTEMFGELGGKVAKFVLGFIPGIGPLARASAAGDITGGGGNIGSMLAMGASALVGPGALFGATKLGRALFGKGYGSDEARMALLKRVGGVEEIYNRRARGLYMPGNQRAPLSGFLSRFLSPRTPFASINPNFFESVPNPNYYPSSPLPPNGSSGSRVTSSLFEASDVLLGMGGPGGDPGQRRRKGRFGRMIDRMDIKIPSMGSPFKRYMDQINLQSFGLDPVTGEYVFTDVDNRQGRVRGEAVDRLNRRQNRGIIDKMDVRIPSIGSPFKRYMDQMDLQLSGLDPATGEYVFTDLEGGQRRVRGEAIDRLNRRRGFRSRLGRGVRGFGKGALIAGGVTAAAAGILGLFPGKGRSQTTQFDPATGQMVPVQGGGGIDFSGAGSVLSGGFEGATIGATIGSVVPGIGTAAGAVIGGIIGGIAPLMDKGVRESLSEMLSQLGDGLGKTFKFFVNGIITILNGVLTVFQIIPRLAIGLVRSAYENIPGANLIPGLKGALEFGESVANFQIPTLYGGKNYYGPSMALEAQMSGRRPMVVNDGEFVIPKDGFPTLAGLVANNLRSTNALRESPTNTQVNITLAITTNSVVADASELANTLREPVYQIINDAWAEATASNVQRSRVN